MPEVSLSTMWAKGRFKHMAEFVAKAKKLGFTRVEANASISPQKLDDLIKTAIPISSIHSPCPATLSSKGIPVANLSLSSLEESERQEAVSFAKKTIDLASSIGAKAVVLHMGEVPVDLSLEDKLHHLYNENFTGTKEYTQVQEELIYQRASKAPPYLEAAKKSLEELSEHSQKQNVMLGLETRFYLYEIPDIDEMAELLNEVEGRLIGYWHDVGHAEVKQRLGFTSHEDWLLRFNHEMLGVHLHDVLGISDHHPLGKGNVDWEMVSKYLPRQAIKVCEIAEWHEEEDIQGVVDFLQEKGLL